MTATATELYTGKYGIMDTDGHIVEPADLWTGELMEAKYKGRGLQFGHTADGRPVFVAYPASFDWTWVSLKVLKAVGLVWDVKVAKVKQTLEEAAA